MASSSLGSISLEGSGIQEEEMLPLHFHYKGRPLAESNAGLPISDGRFLFVGVFI